MLEKIVTGFGGGQSGLDAIALACRLAPDVGGELVVVFPYHPLLADLPSEKVEDRISAEVEPLIARTRAKVTYRWSSSSWPIHALHEMADYEAADLIVFGAAREGLGDRLHLSLMERMIHGAPCAVAVVPAGYSELPAQALHRVGVGFSSSHEGRRAIALGRELARRSGAALTVVAGAGLEPALASYAFSSPALEEVEREMYEETERLLASTCEELSADEGVPLDHETIRGDPASVLVQRSSELDLLVLGSRAYGPLRHALLGSVSARVMREAHCPVLVVPRTAAGGNEHPDEQRAGAAQRA